MQNAMLLMCNGAESRSVYSLLFCVNISLCLDLTTVSSDPLMLIQLSSWGLKEGCSESTFPINENTIELTHLLHHVFYSPL